MKVVCMSNINGGLLLITLIVRVRLIREIIVLSSKQHTRIDQLFQTGREKYRIITT